MDSIGLGGGGGGGSGGCGWRYHCKVSSLRASVVANPINDLLQRSDMDHTYKTLAQLHKMPGRKEPISEKN